MRWPVNQCYWCANVAALYCCDESRGAGAASELYAMLSVLWLWLCRSCTDVLRVAIYYDIMLLSCACPAIQIAETYNAVVAPVLRCTASHGAMSHWAVCYAVCAVIVSKLLHCMLMLLCCAVLTALMSCNVTSAVVPELPCTALYCAVSHCAARYAICSLFWLCRSCCIACSCCCGVLYCMWLNVSFIYCFAVRACNVASAVAPVLRCTASHGAMSHWAVCYAVCAVIVSKLLHCMLMLLCCTYCVDVM